LLFSQRMHPDVLRQITDMGTKGDDLYVAHPVT